MNGLKQFVTKFYYQNLKEMNLLAWKKLPSLQTQEMGLVLVEGEQGRRLILTMGQQVINPCQELILTNFQKCTTTLSPIMG